MKTLWFIYTIGTPIRMLKYEMTTNNQKRAVIYFFLLACIAAILIAFSIPGLIFSPGVPLPEIKVPTGIDYTGQPTRMENISPPFLIKVFAAIISFVTLLLTVIFLIRKIPWRVFLKTYLFSFSLFLAFLVILGVVLSLLNPPSQNTPTAIQQPTIFPIIDVHNPTQQNEHPFSLDVYIFLWIGLAIIGLLLVFLWISWKSENRPSGDLIKQEAERALQAIRKGSDLKGVIIHCYQQMSQGLQKEQGLEFEDSMTAREFEILLEKRGIPRQPVIQLTRLFENVRYGVQQPTTQDEINAVESLQTIIQYTKKPTL